MPAAISILHIAAAILCFVELAIVGYLISPWTSNPWGLSTPRIFDFMMFSSIWSLLILAYVALSPRFFSNLSHGLVALAMEWITMMFWFAGAIALADYLPEAWQGLCELKVYCNSYKSGVVFGFFIWLLFLAIAVLDNIGFKRSRGHHTSAPCTAA